MNLGYFSLQICCNFFEKQSHIANTSPHLKKITVFHSLCMQPSSKCCLSNAQHYDVKTFARNFSDSLRMSCLYIYMYFPKFTNLTTNKQSLNNTNFNWPAIVFMCYLWHLPDVWISLMCISCDNDFRRPCFKVNVIWHHFSYLCHERCSRICDFFSASKGRF